MQGQSTVSIIVFTSLLSLSLKFVIFIATLHFIFSAENFVKVAEQYLMFPPLCRDGCRFCLFILQSSIIVFLIMYNKMINL